MHALPTMSALPLVLVSGVFGGLGAALRVLAILVCTERAGLPMRYTVLLVNLVGSAIAGACTAAFERTDPGGMARAAVIGGVLGGFTTFSSYAIECIERWQRGFRAAAVAYAVASLAGCGVAAWQGFELARRLWP
jgi:CrcB protein